MSLRRTGATYGEDVLVVDLSTGRIERSPIESLWIDDFLGGRGIAARLLWDQLDDEYASLDGGPLVISTGTLSGTTAPMSGRTNVTCTSPATGLYFKANVGGHFGVACKLNGIDHVMFLGSAEKPVYLWIDHEKIELRPADSLWGETVRRTTRALKAVHGTGTSVACIGPAGENQVAYASIMTSCYNAAGRGGVGALMGRKRLKAIAVARPNGTRACVDAERFAEVVSETREALYADTMANSYYRLGTAAGISLKNELGTLPSFNFRLGHLDPIEELTSEHWNESGKLYGRAGCASCLYSCHRHLRIEDGRYRGTYSGGPEYESVASLGTGTGVSSIGAVQRANELCNDLGLDTISTGCAIQWLMETAERGLLPPEYSDGYEIAFGSEDALISLPTLIAERTGPGGLIADGVKAAAEQIGGESWKWAIQTRGLEQSGVETRCTMGYALAFAVNPRGPDHLHTECLAERGNTPEGRALIEQITGSAEYARADITAKRADIVRWHEDIYAVSDAVGLCAFTTTASYGCTPARIGALFESLTGIPKSEETLMLAGRRIITLERLINLRLGWCDDPAEYAPWRMLHESMNDRTETEHSLAPDTIAGMVHDYRKAHGWDVISGVPAKEVLEELGLLALMEMSDHD